MWVAGWLQVVSIVKDFAGRPYSQRPYLNERNGFTFYYSHIDLFVENKSFFGKYLTCEYGYIF